jgi:hypothetical protein
MMNEMCKWKEYMIRHLLHADAKALAKARQKLQQRRYLFAQSLHLGLQRLHLLLLHVALVPAPESRCVHAKQAQCSHKSKAAADWSPSSPAFMFDSDSASTP